MVRKKRQSGRILPVVLLLVLLAGGGFAAWYFLLYVKSPQYALNQFLAAVKANDAESVAKWTDSGGSLMMLFTTMGADPVGLIYPGYKSEELGRVEKLEVGTLTQKDDTTAEVPMTMEVVDAQGSKETRKPVYVLKKSEEGWKVAVEPTIGGSFNEVVPPAFQARVKREAGRFLSQPGLGDMVRAQIKSLQAVIDQYPQLKAFLKEIGL